MELFARKVLKISAMILAFLLFWLICYMMSAPLGADECDNICEKLEIIETKVDVIQIQIDDIILKLIK